MSMSTEQALSYLNKAEDKEAKVTETPSVEETKSEEVNVDSPEDATKVQETTEPTKDDGKSNDGDQPKVEDKGSDEPKVEETKGDKKKEMTPQDYAFMKQKDKNRKLQDKYDKLNTKFNETNKQKDARIQELEEALKKYQNLKSEDFKKNDGSIDYDAFTDWKVQQRDMQNEVSSLKQSMEQDQLQHAIDYDRYVTEKCFEGKELEEYDNLVATKGGIFANEIHKVDRTNAAFNYLETLNDYPIVLRELMVNPNRWLGTMFRSSDPDMIKWNTARVADQILNEYYSSKKPETAAVQQQAKPAMPVIGKQISNAGATKADNSQSLVSSMDTINKYLNAHRKGH